MKPLNGVELAALDMRRRARIIEKNEEGVSYDERLLVNWANSKKFKEIKEVVELENLFLLLKYGAQVRISDKLKSGEDLTKLDLEHLKLVKDTLVDIYKLKFGEKHVQVNVGYKDIQDLIFNDNSNRQ